MASSRSVAPVVWEFGHPLWRGATDVQTVLAWLVGASSRVHIGTGAISERGIVLARSSSCAHVGRLSALTSCALASTLDDVSHERPRDDDIFALANKVHDRIRKSCEQAPSCSWTRSETNALGVPAKGGIFEPDAEGLPRLGRSGDVKRPMNRAYSVDTVPSSSSGRTLASASSRRERAAQSAAAGSAQRDRSNISA